MLINLVFCDFLRTCDTAAELSDVSSGCWLNNLEFIVTTIVRNILSFSLKKIGWYSCTSLPKI